ncbi:MAG: 3-hydroxyacyl-ACP dehydratase FabZ family protein [Nitrospirota bacterium]
MPHKFPFAMLDRVIEVVPGKHAAAEKTITSDSFFGNGRPFFPELFLIEALAQLGAVAAVPAGAGTGTKGPREDAIGYLAGINGAKFYIRPRPGDKVMFSVDYEAGMGGLFRFKGKATVGGELAAECGMTFTAPGR